ncbi:molybdopterin cofactor-binding domain-containing protein [Phenylobacterium sp. J367]|uniref:molybdopterin cofactor-binding domain-containing protein n=1 Tax=Phenylobacterium sp. J367 TaxID=2898435 RepID=UPI0035B409FC
MKFDKPAATNPIDQLKVVGQPTPRIEGPLKTTGTAPYAYERHDVAPDAAYGWVVVASIANGRIRTMDVVAARRAPGVLTVVTAETAGPIAKARRNTVRLLGGPEIQHYGQVVAMVVAETLEQARAAAALVRVAYDTEAGAYDLEAAKEAAVRPQRITSGAPDTAVGDFAGAFAAAPVQLDATYRTPGHAHAMMEPHATLAVWKGEQLTVWTSNQMVDWGRTDLAEMLAIPKERVRVVSPFVGGGFGGKLFVRAECLLAALGARAAGRPVKVALPRPAMFNNTPHRAATIQRIRIGATRDGRITAIGHESWQGDQAGGRSDGHVSQTRLLYAGANRMTQTRLARLDLPEHNAMRAPGEASGMMALEIAMDEMAEKLGMDPVQFRILNDTQVNPERPERPFSQRQLVECLRQGAERFGWSRRNPSPGQTRSGRWLVGLGMAAAFRGAPVQKSAARVRLEAGPLVVVETDMTDIGTGTYTIIAQTAAETLGVPLHQVRVRLGDSDFPVSAGSGGQWGAASSTSGVYAACMNLRGQVAAKFGFEPAQTAFADGRVSSGGRPLRLPRPPAFRRRMQSSSASSCGRPNSPPSAPTSSRWLSTPTRPRPGSGGCSRCARPAGSSTRSPPAAR